MIHSPCCIPRSFDVEQRSHRVVARDIVSVLHAVVNSPFGVAQALQQLGAESEVREIDSAELRYALRQLSADDVPSELPENVGVIVMVLVDADRTLSQGEVADRVDVTTQTVRNHGAALEATGLAVQGNRGWRFEVSFRHERGSGVIPETCSGAVGDVVDAVCNAVRGECSCGDGCVEAVRRTRRGGGCRAGRWCRVAASLCGWPSDGDAGGRVVREVVIGEEPCQEPIVGSSDSSDGDGPGGGSDGGSRDSEVFDDDRSDGCGNDEGGAVWRLMLISRVCRLLGRRRVINGALGVVASVGWRGVYWFSGRSVE